MIYICSIYGPNSPPRAMTGRPGRCGHARWSWRKHPTPRAAAPHPGNGSIISVNVCFHWEMSSLPVIFLLLSRFPPFHTEKRKIVNRYGRFSIMKPHGFGSGTTLLRYEDVLLLEFRMNLRPQLGLLHFMSVAGKTPVSWTFTGYKSQTKTIPYYSFALLWLWGPVE